jgi:uncharacterized coiled-coil DUF342 family protein
MNIKQLSSIVLAATFLCGVAWAQEMTRDEWQEEMNRYTQLRDELSTKVSELRSQISALQDQSTQLDADIKKCMDDLYALVGSNADAAAAYRAEIEAAENKAAELMRLSDADLLARSGEVDELAARVKSLWENKLSLIPEFWDRLTSLNDKVKSLRSTIAGTGKTYTVGTWARDRDCLWNISKKRDIYNNAWMWPKIWQGNRDQIRDPDIIHPGQKLKIPPAGEMNAEEKAAARSYYSRKSPQL